MVSNSLLISTLSLGGLNLLSPFATNEDSRLRTNLLLIISGFFLVNVLIIDYLFLNFIEIDITLFSFGKYKIALHTEALGMIFLNLLAVLWIFSLIYTTSFLAINKIKNTSRFLFFLNCTILCGALVALSANLFTMFVFYEALTLCTIPLIIHQNSTKIRIGLYKYLKILLGSSLIFFLTAIMVVYAKIGHGDFAYEGFLEGFFANNYALILLLFFIFGISKAALFPLHGWLPAAMVASYPVSALLHAVVVVKTGLFCIYKVLVYVFGLAYLQSLVSDYSFNFLLLIPAFTIIYSSVMAIKAREIKMILAYSTISQLSIALMSAFIFTPKALAAAILHMLSHSFAKICLFYGAGGFYSLYHTYKLEDLIGMGRRMPKTSLIFLIASLSLVGIPPLGGFVSKFYIMLAAADAQNIPVMIILLISSVLSAIYMGKILIYIYMPDKKTLEENSESKLPWPMICSLLLCLTGVVLFYPLQQTFINGFLLFL